MSYSFEYPCYSCKKEEKCTDKDKIQQGLDDIHSEGFSDEGGHMGGGTIVLMCVHCETKI